MRSPDASSQELRDLDEVCRLAAEGKPVIDPQLRSRIERRAAGVHAGRVPSTGNFSTRVIRESRGPVDEIQERELTVAQCDLVRMEETPRLVNPETGEQYVLVRADDYDRLQGE